MRTVLEESIGNLFQITLSAPLESQPLSQVGVSHYGDTNSLSTNNWYLGVPVDAVFQRGHGSG